MARLQSGTRIYGNAIIDTSLSIDGNTAATSTSTGALKVSGGIGVIGNIHSSGNITVINASLGNTATANYLAGTLTTSSQPNITSVGTLTSLTVTNALSAGTLSVGDATITGNLVVTGTTITANVASISVKDPIIEQGGTANGTLLLTDDGMDRGQLLHYYNSGNQVNAFMGWKNANSEFVFAKSSTVSNNVVSVAELGNIRADYFIGNIIGSVQTAVSVTNNAQPNITSVGILSELTVSGNLNATLTTPAQPNITSLGLLTALNVNGTVNLGNIGNVKIYGGSNSYLLKTDGTGNLSWVSPETSSLTSVVDIFTGDGVQTTFTLASAPKDANFTMVAVQGILQPKNSYSVSGLDLTFSSAPPEFAIVEVTTFGGSVSSGGGGTVSNYGNVNVAAYLSSEGYITSSALTGYVTGTPWTTAGYLTTSDYKDSNVGAYLANYTGYIANATHANTAETAITVAGSNVSGQVSNAATLNGYSDTYFATATQGAKADSALQSGSNISVLNNDSGYLIAANLSTYATQTYVGTEIANLVASAPAALNTLNELANALGNDASYSTTITNSLANKLSTSNFASTANTWISTQTTSNLAEGTNLYFTATRANSAIDSRITKTFIDGLGVVANISNIAYSVAGANVTGTVSLATTATTAGTVTTAAQPNITSVGTLTSLNVTANITAGNINAGNLLVANYHSGNGSLLTSITGANVTGTVANATYATTSGSATSVAGANVTGQVANALIATTAITANAVAGANVTGAVAYATTANSVAVANVSGIGNIATINKDGNASNILYGNGVFAAAPVAGSSYGNSNVVTLLTSYGSNVITTTGNISAGNVIGNHYGAGNNLSNIQGANVTGAVAYATTANSVAVANVTSIGNIATINKDGNASNVLYGNGVFAAAPSGGGTTPDILSPFLFL